MIFDPLPARVIRTLTLALGLSLAMSVAAQTYESAQGRGGVRVRLTCEDGLVDKPCTLRGVNSAGIADAPTRLRFVAGTSLADTLREGIEHAGAATSGGDFPPTDEDRALLARLDVALCNDSDKMQGLVWACAAGDQQVVLFLRALCSRCTAEPIVMRKRP